MDRLGNCSPFPVFTRCRTSQFGVNVETYREIYSLGYFLWYLGALTVWRKLGLSGKRICLPMQEMLRDTGLIPGSGRSPGGGPGNPLQYSCLGNPIDRGGWQAAVHRVMPMHARAGPGHPWPRNRSLQLWLLSGPGQAPEGLLTPPP